MCTVQCVQCQMKCNSWGCLVRFPNPLSSQLENLTRGCPCPTVPVDALKQIWELQHTCPAIARLIWWNMRSVYVCVQRSKQWRVCGHTGRTQLTQLFFPHWRNTNRVLAPHLNIGVQLKGASVARWTLWIICLYFEEGWLNLQWMTWHVFLLIQLMSRNLSEARAQLALDQRAASLVILTRDQVLLTPPPPFCWLAPRAPICAQAELIWGPWNNNYRSYSQSIDTEWATFRGQPAQCSSKLFSQHKFKLLDVSALQYGLYIQDTPVAVVLFPPSPLAGCL